MMFPESKNVYFIKFLLHPNFTPYQPTIPGLIVLIFGCNRNLMKYTFLGSGNIIDYHCRLYFCRPFDQLPKSSSNTAWTASSQPAPCSALSLLPPPVLLSGNRQNISFVCVRCHFGCPSQLRTRH